MKSWPRIALLCMIVVAVPVAAPAASVLGGFEKGMKRLEQKLCKASPSQKCQRSNKRMKTPPRHHRVPEAQTPAAPKDKPSAEIKTQAAPQKPVPVPQLRPETLTPAKPEKSAIPVPVPKPMPAEPKVLPPVPELKPDVPKPQAAPALPAPVEMPSAQDGNCLAALIKAGASFSPVPQPGTVAECAVENPVRVNSISGKNGTIKLPDQPILNCAFALKFTTWVETSAQPLAQASQGASIVALGTGPGFDCRGRNGDASAKTSEHGTGNAVDIATVSFGNKQQIQVKDAINPQATGFGFLRDLRAAACVEFTTVLGPGANSAHAEHFHIDLAERKGGYRICE
jgi:hypothetical protein